jgi:hypothetical protein
MPIYVLGYMSVCAFRPHIPPPPIHSLYPLSANFLPTHLSPFLCLYNLSATGESRSRSQGTMRKGDRVTWESNRIAVILFTGRQVSENACYECVTVQCHMG